MARERPVRRWWRLPSGQPYRSARKPNTRAVEIDGPVAPPPRPALAPDVKEFGSRQAPETSGETEIETEKPKRSRKASPEGAKSGKAGDTDGD